MISLFAIDGLTHAEIAADLGVPEGTIWSRLHTAKKKLAQALVQPVTGETGSENSQLSVLGSRFSFPTGSGKQPLDLVTDLVWEISGLPAG